MRKSLAAGVIGAAVLLFFIANRGAYEGYFHGDDLANILGTTRYASPSVLAKAYLSPRLMETNLRPPGHFFFYAFGHAAGLHFRWYVLAIQLIHFLNVWLVWRLARKAGLETWAASAGALFFAFHMGVFDALWKPMYIFDLLCASFCLLSLISLANRRWVLSFVFFWTAYKSKEVAIMLPAALLAWEIWLGKRQWKRLLPFFAVSFSFGLQALLSKAALGTDYALRFRAADIWKCAGFYASKFLLLGKPALAVALAILLIASLAVLTRDRRVWFGFATALLLLVPMLVLPGRLYGAYLYAPLAGAAIAAAALAQFSRRQWAVALFFVLWLPMNYAELRTQRKAALNFAQEDRAYVAGLSASLSRWSSANTAILDGVPAGLNVWGADAALRLVSRPELKTVRMDGGAGWNALSGTVAVISWNPVFRRVETASGIAGRPEAAYIDIDYAAPFWQLREGWYERENRLCWIEHRAVALLRRPAAAREFELIAVVNELLANVGPTHVTVLLDDRRIGEAEIRSAGIHRVRWPLPSGTGETAHVEFRASPGFRPSSPSDPRTLGIAIAGFGFK